MGAAASDLVNVGFSWLIVLMAAGGYFMTWRRTKEKWSFWITLSVGWALLAISNTLVVLDPVQQISLPTALALASYVFVMSSLLLLFLRLTRVLRSQGPQSVNDAESQRGSTKR